MILPWHQPLWSTLQKSRQEGRLAHALLITGCTGIGKHQLAMDLARSLLCREPHTDGLACGRCRACILFGAGTHPDFLQVAPPEEGKVISVDQIRELNRYVALKTQEVGARVVIIAPAHRMNVNASNSLLKTLEEPPAGSVMILVSDQPATLPATIRSRCQQLMLPTPPRAEALAWLQQHLGARGLDHDQALLLLNLAHGAPLAAAALAADDHLEARKEFFSQWQALADGTAEPVTVAAEMEKRPVASLLRMLQSWVADMIRFRGGNAAMDNGDLQAALQRQAQALDLTELFLYWDQVKDAVRLAPGQINAQMLLEDTLIAWQRLPRRRTAP